MSNIRISGIQLVRIMVQPAYMVPDEELGIRYELLPSAPDPDAEIPPGTALTQGIIGDVRVRTDEALCAASAIAFLQADGGHHPPSDIMEGSPYVAHVLWDYIRAQLSGLLAAAELDLSTVPRKTPRYTAHGVDCTSVESGFSDLDA